MVYSTNNSKISNFTDLKSWQQSHQLAISIYKTTSKYPNSELYSLVSQMRRCAISISSNIVEGFSRYSTKEKINFYYISKGSLTELQNQLLLSKDIGYLNQNNFEILYDNTIICIKLINGLIRSLKPNTIY